MSLNTASEAATMPSQFSGLPFFSDCCRRAHMLPDPEAFFSISQSVSKQKFTSSSFSPSLSFQALSPPGNSDVSAEGRTAPEEAPNHCAALQHPKETFKSKSATEYHISLSLLCLLQFIRCIQKQQHKVHSKQNIFSFYFFLKCTHKVF